MKHLRISALWAILSIVTALAASTAGASSTRSVDADQIKSSDHTKTYSLPSASDTVVGRASTDTLSNKTISGASNTLQQLPVSSQLVQDSFSGDGTTTAFTLSFSPPASAGATAYLDGVALTQGVGNDYTISGTTLTMNTAPATGQKLLVVYSKY